MQTGGLARMESNHQTILFNILKKKKRNKMD
jgi:hypothetical protein